MKRAILALLIGATVLAQEKNENVKIELREMVLPPKPNKSARHEPRGGGGGQAFMFADPHAPGKPVIIQTGRHDDKVIAEIKEDLAIMSKLINEAVIQDLLEAQRRALGIVLRVQGRRSPNMFIEGHGAIFFVNVAIPLVGPTKASLEPAKMKEDQNSDWEEARRELFGKPRSFGPWNEAVAGEVPFDQAKVDELKAGLTQALRNGVNIRHMRPEDYITIVVSGSGPASSVQTIRSHDSSEDVMIFSGDDRAVETSTMVLKVRKGDIQPSKKDDGEPFSKKVSVAVY